MEHNPLIAVLVNDLLHWLLGLAGIRVHGDVVPAYLIMALIVTLIIVLTVKLLVRNLSLFPGRLQYSLEALYKFFRNLLDDMVGHEGRQFLPAVGTLGIFIASCNLIGLLPEMASPTTNINVTAGCALFIFSYYNYQGIRRHGLWGYIRTFMGPAWWMAFIMMPIELISHLSRLLSLSIRLFGNIFGEDLVILILASLIPFVAPLPMMVMAIFTSLIQAYVFMMLSTVYLAGATRSEH